MNDLIEKQLRANDEEVEADWRRVQTWVEERFGRETGMEAILFLIGIQSRGRGYEPDLEKEKKQDTIMEGTYCAFETLGFYERVGLDENGFWIWERTVEQIPKLSIEDQEKLLKLGIVRYFEDHLDASTPRRSDDEPEA